MSQITHRTTRAALRLHAAHTMAEAVRWEKSAAPTTDADDTRGRGSEVSDPTADAALDTARLAVSAACVRAERAAADCTRRMLAASQEVQAAVTRWEGIRP